MTANCPYCDKTNDIVLSLPPSIADDYIEDILCWNCETLFDVKIEWEPKLHEERIEYAQCTSCGTLGKKRNMCIRGTTSPYPQKTQYHKLCYECYCALMANEIDD